jgi:H+/Cl- antiporter ClcA
LISSLFGDCLYYYVGGTLAGPVGTLISQPFDTCKIHLQTKRPLNILSRTFGENIVWVYRGTTPSIIGYGVEKSLVFGTYSAMCRVVQLDEHNGKNIFFAGLVAG